MLTTSWEVCLLVQPSQKQASQRGRGSPGLVSSFRALHSAVPDNPDLFLEIPVTGAAQPLLDEAGCTGSLSLVLNKPLHILFVWSCGLHTNMSHSETVPWYQQRPSFRAQPLRLHWKSWLSLPVTPLLPFQCFLAIYGNKHTIEKNISTSRQWNISTKEK